MTRPAQFVFAILALPAVARAAWRVHSLRRGRDLERWLLALRDVRAFSERGLGGWLRRRPGWLAALVERLLPILPPRGHGPCFKRSLVLLDLWSRCGLAPTFHLGMRHGVPRSQQDAGASGIEPDTDWRGDVDLHAWVTTDIVSTPSDHHEIWRI